jgi:hypothetical protein
VNVRIVHSNDRAALRKRSVIYDLVLLHARVEYGTARRVRHNSIAVARVLTRS